MATNMFNLTRQDVACLNCCKFIFLGPSTMAVGYQQAWVEARAIWGPPWPSGYDHH